MSTENYVIIARNQVRKNISFYFDVHIARKEGSCFVMFFKTDRFAYEQVVNESYMVIWDLEDHLKTKKSENTHVLLYRQTLFANPSSGAKQWISQYLL